MDKLLFPTGSMGQGFTALEETEFSYTGMECVAPHVLGATELKLVNFIY